MSFIPKRVFFEEASLNYPLGAQLYKKFKNDGITTSIIGSHNRVTGIPGKTPQQIYLESKKTLVVGVRKTLKFETCKPSAHYQLPLCTSCSGKCEYCYLNTTLGSRPYVRVYVNLEEILGAAKEYIKERSPEVTLFEGAATSDPLTVEEYTGALKKTIEFFGGQALGRFRFVTKFTGVDSLLDAKHLGHTRFRFSINTPQVIKNYEHNTPGALERIGAAVKVAEAGYPLGFIIAPVIIYTGWQGDYKEMLLKLRKALGPAAQKDITFEIISHRYTARAKKRILEIFPGSSLPMDENDRKFKYGQFGYGKYVYPKEIMDQMGSVFNETLPRAFPAATQNYLI